MGISAAGKEWNTLLLLPRIKRLFCAIYKKGNACKRSYSGGRLLKSFLRHGRIVQKPMQEKERKKIRQVAKAMHGQKTKKKQQLNERATPLVPKKQCDWLYSFAITYKHSNCSGNLQGIVVWPLVGLSRQKLLFISRLIIKL